MMAHKLFRGTSSLFMAASSSLRVRPTTPIIGGPQARTIDESVCRSQGQKSTHSPFIVPLSATTPTPLIGGPHRQKPTAGVMPRSGYDATNMRVAANPRPAGSAGGTGKPRNDKPSSGANSDGNGSGGGKGIGGRGKGNNGRDGNNNGPKETTEQGPRRGNEDEEPTTENAVDESQIPWKDVRIPLEGRGWTFWL